MGRSVKVEDAVWTTSFRGIGDTGILRVPRCVFLIENRSSVNVDPESRPSNKSQKEHNVVISVLCTMHRDRSYRMEMLAEMGSLFARLLKYFAIINQESFNCTSLFY